jgi:methionyl aminopeptidase
MRLLRRTLIKIAAAAPFTSIVGTASAKDFRADDPASIQLNAGLIGSRTQAEIVAESRRIAPLLSDIVARAGRGLKPGDTTQQINGRLIEELSAIGLAAAMLGYEGFPAASAISVDPAFLSAPPDDTVLREGATATIELCGSSAAAYASQGWTFPVGEISSERRKLIAAARTGLTAGIDAIDNGVTPREIGRAIGHAVTALGYSPVQEFCGYAMGQKRIQQPSILNYDAGTEDIIPPGTILNIYVIVASRPTRLRLLSNNAVISRDGDNAAVATAMVVVEPSGKFVLTKMIP